MFAFPYRACRAAIDLEEGESTRHQTLMAQERDMDLSTLAGISTVTETTDNPIARRSPPGVLVLTASRQVVYRNAEARERTDQLSRWELQRPANGVLAPCLVSMCDELLAMLRKRTDVKDSEHLMIVRSCGDPSNPILVRGFGLPSRQDPGTPHVLLLLERVGQRKVTPPRAAKEHCRLTDREQDVVVYVARGLTNKQIAASLNISVQTVKEHIKNLLCKTRTTTRTGMLSYLMLNERGPSESKGAKAPSAVSPPNGSTAPGAR
jgi:DNA-binding CsgD family transcriptional regulator